MHFKHLINMPYYKDFTTHEVLKMKYLVFLMDML